MSSLMTAAPVIDAAPNLIPTGNLWVSLPAISRADAGIYRVGILREDTNCLLDLVGDETGQNPFLAPAFVQAGKYLMLKNIHWSRLEYWLPDFAADLTDELHVHGTIFAPNELNGAVYLLELTSDTSESQALEVGLEGRWQGLEEVVFSSRPVECKTPIWQDPWTGSLVGEANARMPLVAWALQSSEEGTWWVEENSFHWQKTLRISRDHPVKLAFYLAVNLERDGARTSAMHLKRVGYTELLSQTCHWLNKHKRACADAGVERVLNENLFFNYFYAQGLCLDSGKLVMITSRSNQYYVCAAFWARDAYLWSLPALTLVDPAQARRALLSGLGRYRERAAEHALYLNGRQLYPGFELDEACAPIIGIGGYLEASGDNSLLSCREVLAALETWENCLREHFNESLGLYDTFLTPHDDPTEFPYLTYNNVLVWKAFTIAAEIMGGLKSDEGGIYRKKANELRVAINCHLIFAGPYGNQYIGAINSQGQPQWVEFPGGSLALLPYYGFCSAQDETYQATLKWIFSAANPYYFQSCLYPGVGSAHFPYPCSFDLANRMICGEVNALDEVLHTQMDHGIACESFDPESGIVRTGAAFATGAGFLAQGIQRIVSTSMKK
jgi:hypothetical protein